MSVSMHKRQKTPMLALRLIRTVAMEMSLTHPIVALATVKGFLPTEGSSNGELTLAFRRFKLQMSSSGINTTGFRCAKVFVHGTVLSLRNSLIGRLFEEYRCPVVCWHTMNAAQIARPIRSDVSACSTTSAGISRDVACSRHFDEVLTLRQQGQ